MQGSGGFSPTGGSSGFPGGGASGGRSGSSCGRFSINHAADLIFVVGRNQSMATNFAWVQSAIESVVSANDAAIDFGYQDFPARGTCMSPNACCPSTAPPVYPQHKNSGPINQALQCDPGPAANTCVASNDSRPIFQTLMKTSTLFNDSFGIDQNLVLLTDGPPGCPGDADPCGDTAMVLSKLNANYFVKTSVVAIGSDAAMDSCLSSLVRQGVAKSLMMASDMKQLVNVLNSIVMPVAAASCVITLLSPPPDPQVTIMVQGTEIKRDSQPSGWAFSPAGSNQIQVYGDACKALQGANRSEIHVTIAGCSP